MRRIGLLGVGVVVGLVAGGGLVWAAVPEPGTGAVTACYATSGASKGILRVVDTQAGETCNAGENTLRLQSTQCDGYPRPGLDWRGCDLHGANLASQYLTATRMNGTNLAFANFTQAALAGTDFTGANLAGALFSSADLTNVTLSGANLTGAQLAPGSGPATRMTGVTGMTAPQLRLVARVRRGGYGVKCPATAVDLHRIEFGALNATGFNLLNFDLSQSGLAGANFTGANLTNTFLGGTNLSGANLTNANLTCANDMDSAFVSNVVWNNTTCPDGTNSDNNGGTCAGHF